MPWSCAQAKTPESREPQRLLNPKENLITYLNLVAKNTLHSDAAHSHLCKIKLLALSGYGGGGGSDFPKIENR